jgi:peroxiredoxin
LSAALAALAALLPFRTDAQAQAPPQPPAPAARGGIGANLEYPVLPIGTTLPDFNLPGVDSKTHKASEYSGKAIAIVFESNHCPVSQLYEGRIEKLYADYKNKGVTLVAINPNNPKTVRLDELGYTDVTDSLPEMKLRAQFRGIDWPYLYDGDTQGVSMKFGAVATPHIFIFDEQRKLRYQGRIDDNQREELVKSQDARNALDAILAGKPAPVAETRAFGCTTKWLSKASGVEQEWARIQAEPVNVEMVDAAALKELRANNTDKVMLIHFWSTGCALCTSEFFDLETTYRMFRKRAFNLVTVSTNGPADAAASASIDVNSVIVAPSPQAIAALDKIRNRDVTIFPDHI